MTLLPWRLCLQHRKIDNTGQHLICSVTWETESGIRLPQLRDFVKSAVEEKRKVNVANLIACSAWKARSVFLLLKNCLARCPISISFSLTANKIVNFNVTARKIYHPWCRAFHYSCGKYSIYLARGRPRVYVIRLYMTVKINSILKPRLCRLYGTIGCCILRSIAADFLYEIFLIEIYIYISIKIVHYKYWKDVIQQSNIPEI